MKTAHALAHEQPTLNVTPMEHALLAVTFRIGPQQYGLPVAFVIEIVRLPALVTLAGASPAVIGLLNLRGQYVPVLDGRILIGEPVTYTLNNQVVVAGRIEDNIVIPLLGLLVDQVIDVRTLSLYQLTRIEGGVAASFLSSVIKAGDESVLLFDFDALLHIVPEGTVTNMTSLQQQEHFDG